MKSFPLIAIWCIGFGVYLILKDVINHIKELPSLKKHVFFFKLPVNLYAIIIALIFASVLSQVYYVKEIRDLKSIVTLNEQDKTMEIKSKLLNFYERVIFLRENIPVDFDSEEYPKYCNETINEILVFSDWITENAGALRMQIFKEITHFPFFNLEEALYGDRRKLDLNLIQIEENLNNLIKNNKWKNYVNR